MRPILEVNRISKKFTINRHNPSYLSLRDSIGSFFKNPRVSHEIFWALHDVSFDVYPGESIGIVGRNGAGKSTLLKVLSKITPPTGGKITARGRIASLLEVGTGFHPELSGRENVFLNGSILGMKKIEIQKKYDEIVNFSGVEKFIDTPLKHYSSGMQLRLAFAVATYLDPEILIIDEVLAVGDHAFQQKCIDKMTSISKSGRTILFVSHNFSALKALCKRGILLEHGKKVHEGEISQVIDFYNANHRLQGKLINLLAVDRKQHLRELIFSEIRFKKENFNFGEMLEFSIKLHRAKQQKFEELDLGVAIIDKNQNYLVHMSNRFLNLRIDHLSDDQEYIFKCENNLRPGTYSLTLFLRVDGKVQDWLTDLIEVSIVDGNPYGFKDSGNIQGLTFPKFTITNK